MEIDNSLKKVLTSGCDERIIFPDGVNHNNYNMNPFNHSGLISRGSCTCGSLNPETYNILKDIQLSKFETKFEDIVRHQEKQLKELNLLTMKPVEYIANVAEDGFENNPVMFINIHLSGSASYENRVTVNHI